MTARLGFWALVAATAALYLVMIGVTLPRLTAAAGGLVPFDLRPFGYTAAEARTLVAALGEEGRSYYLTVQHRLDTVYPALLALTLALVFLRLAPGRAGGALAALALLGATFDYAENAAVAAMLRAGPAGFTAESAAAASRWTVAKSAATSAALLALLVLLARAGLRRWRGRAA